MQEPVYWIDEYPKNNPKELQSYSTCVIDGKGWRVDPTGRTYCSGEIKEERC